MPQKIPISELEYQKVAIICFGDTEKIKQTLPTIRVLSRQYKDIEIHFVVKEEFADILAGVKEITKIHTIKKEAWALTKMHDKLAKEFIPLVLDLQNDFQSSFLYSAFPGAPKRTYSKCKKEILLRKLGFAGTPPPLWKRFLQTLPKQEYEISDKDFELPK